MTGSRRQAGFSLVELVVVVACLGILGALALPTLTTMIPRVRLSNATTLLANEVSLLRVRAIAKSVRQRMVFTCPGTDCNDSVAIQKEDSGGNWVTIATNSFSGVNLQSAENLMHFSGDDKYLIADTNGTMNIAFGNLGLITLTTPDGQLRRRLVAASVNETTERSGDGGGSWVAE